MAGHKPSGNGRTVPSSSDGAIEITADGVAVNAEIETLRRDIPADNNPPDTSDADDGVDPAQDKEPDTITPNDTVPDADTARKENVEPDEKHSVSDEDESVEDAGSGTVVQEEEKVHLQVRQTTGNKTYFRAGLKFTQVSCDIIVSSETAMVLCSDKYLEVTVVD